MVKKIKRALRQLIKPSYSRIDAVKFGLAGGVLTGFGVAFVTLAGIYGDFAAFTSLISAGYGFLGYSVSGLGVVLGAVYGFVDGFVGTFVFAWLYNKLL